ncbi:unnamed protein product, partial [Allacma fusca]
DIQYILSGGAQHESSPKEYSKAFHVREDIFSKYVRTSIGKDSFFIIVSLGRPVARGEITLSSNDPYKEPIIDPNYLTNNEDIIRMIEAVKKAVNLAENTTPFRKIGSRLTDTPFPGCEHVPHRSDAYFECYIRSLSLTLHHIVGTASMGRPDSPHAVVDTELRVIGTKGLRVMDASIMPIVPVTNTQAPC